MTILARSTVNGTPDSLECGRSVARELTTDSGSSPKLVLTYITINHDAEAYLKGMREVLGAEVPVLGCSAQGVIGTGVVREDGFAAGALALGGDSIALPNAAVRDIQVDTLEKGRALGRALREQSARPPRAVVLHYDPLCDADPERFLEGLAREIECPIIGGASGHSFSYQAVQETYQYYGTEVMQHSAVAVAMAGDFTVEMEICHGCSPVGVEMVVTRAENNVILELDGRPAVEVWCDICGIGVDNTGQTAALAIGIPMGDGAAKEDYLVRAAYKFNPETGGMILGPAIATGTTIMLHHRTVEDVLAGAKRMGLALRERLGTKRVHAALAFECGARTRPFLGAEETLAENLALQKDIAPSAAWLGMMPWGEVYPTGGKPGFHNYSYPILVLADA